MLSCVLMMLIYYKTKAKSLPLSQRRLLKVNSKNTGFYKIVPIQATLTKCYRNSLKNNYARHVIRVGALQLDMDSFKLSYKDNYQVLSDTEGRILRELIEAFPRTVSKTEIMQSLWGGPDHIDENVLQVNMVRLRKALSSIGIEDRIETVRGVGYRLQEGDD